MSAEMVQKMSQMEMSMQLFATQKSDLEASKAELETTAGAQKKAIIGLNEQLASITTRADEVEGLLRSNTVRMEADAEFLMSAEAATRESQAALIASQVELSALMDEGVELHAEHESVQGALELDNAKLKKRCEKLTRQVEVEVGKKDDAQLIAEMETMEVEFSAALKKMTKERDGLTKALAEKEPVLAAVYENNASLAVEAHELHGQLTEISGAFESIQADYEALEATGKADKEALEQARGELKSTTSAAVWSKTKISLLEKELGDMKEKLEATTTEAVLSKEQLESRRNKFALVVGAMSPETKSNGGGMSTSGLSDNWKKALSPIMKKKQNVAFLLNVLKSPKGMAKLRAASAAGDACGAGDAGDGGSESGMAAESKHGGGSYDSPASRVPPPKPSRQPSFLESFADTVADDAVGALPPTPPPQTSARRVSSRRPFSTPTTTSATTPPTSAATPPMSAATPPTSAATAATSTGVATLNPFSIDEDTPALSPANASETRSAGASMSSAPRPKEKKKDAGEYLKQMLHRRRASAAQMDMQGI